MAEMKKVFNELCTKLGLPSDLPLGKDALITGSFCWRMITHDDKPNWLPKDVDIFCAQSAVERIRKYLISKGFRLLFLKKYQYTEGCRNIIEEWNLDTAVYPDDHPQYQQYMKNTTRDTVLDWYQSLSTDYGLPPYPENIQFGLYRKTNTKTRIQLIIAPDDTSDPQTLIKDCFDFPTLENWFDGETVYISYPEAATKRESIFRKKIYINFEGKPIGKRFSDKRNDERCAKYTARGLKITNYKSPVYNDSCMCEDRVEVCKNCGKHI
jgi:hypothetical protein